LTRQPETDRPEIERAQRSGDGTDRPRRPLLERIGLALVALVLAAMFALVSVLSFVGGEPFLGLMGAIGCLMVLWVGSITLFRG